MLFENYSPVISIYIKRKIEEVLINNEPRIRLTGITVNGDDFEKGARAEEANEFLSGATEIDNNRVVIDIFFDIIGVPQPQQVSINLYRVR
jgi:phage baseplate assembly protein W